MEIRCCFLLIVLIFSLLSTNAYQLSSRAFDIEKDAAKPKALSSQYKGHLMASGFNLPTCGQRMWSPQAQQRQAAMTLSMDRYKTLMSQPTTDKEESDSGEKPIPTIVNGELAEEGQFPWQVSLQHSSGKHVCGGAIISNCHIATAAHW